MYQITQNSKARARDNGYICSLYGRKFILICSGGDAAAHRAMAAIGYSQVEICRATDLQIDCMQTVGAETFVIHEV